jgi:hypothetical protein
MTAAAQTRILLLLGVLAALGCGSPGAVTFAIDEPTHPDLDPISGRVSEYLVKAASGAVLGVASVTSLVSGGATDGEERLPLGVLRTTVAPEDVEVDVLSGSELVGMARVRDVSIKAGVQKIYTASVRKPLIFVGATLPDESDPNNGLAAGKILDPTTSLDLANPEAPGARPPPKLPDGMGSAVVTSDGRFLLAGGKNMLTVIDTGSGGTVGTMTLPFSPTRLAVAARDRAAVALGPNDVAIFTDVAGLVTQPAAVSPRMVKLSMAPRTAAFSTDGKRIYILGGGAAVDPCAPGTALAPNSIVTIGVDGSEGATWMLPGFVSDLAVDPTSDQIVLSESVANQVSTLDPQTAAGAVTTRRLFGATCPSALHIVDEQVFAVSSERDRSATDSFILYRGRVVGDAAPQALGFNAPVFEAPTDTPSRDGNISFQIQLRAASLTAYEMAVTPDGNRAVFATRARYHEQAQALQILGIDCTMTVDIVEYGLYSIDARTGTSSYSLRSQLVTAPTANQPCIVCPLSLTDSLEFGCSSSPGDRPAGITAVFGGP